jgi:hypothetical protein
MATGTATKAKAPAKKAAGKAVAKVEKLDTDLTPAKAKALNEKIKGGVTNVIGLLNDAMQGRIWIPLGYKDWSQYVATEFGGAPLQLPTLKRREAVKELVDNGWSTRAIAEATGTHHSTIADDIKATVGSPDSTDADGNVIDAEIVSEDRKVTGLDGKERNVSARPVVNKQADIVKDAQKLRDRLRKCVDEIDGLIARDDFKGHEVEIGQMFAATFDDLWSTTVDLGLDNPLGMPDDEPQSEPVDVDAEVESLPEPEPEPV